MTAPLLRERELFLVKKQSEGNGIRSLQMTADQLFDYSGINVPLVAVCNVPPVAQCNVPPQKWLQ